MNDENRLRWQLNLRIGKKEKKLARELSIADSVIISTYYRRGSMEPVIWIHLATNWYSALVRDRQLATQDFCWTFVIFSEEPGTKVILGNIASWPCQPILSLWMFYAGKCVYFSRAEFFITILQQPLTSSAGPRATLGNPVDKSHYKIASFFSQQATLTFSARIGIRYLPQQMTRDVFCSILTPDHMDTKKKSFDLFP